MPILIRLDVMLAKRRVRSKTLARAIGVAEPSSSSGRVLGQALARGVA